MSSFGNSAYWGVCPIELLTVKLASEQWGISSRRVTKLCEEGRIKNASKIAGAWIMPLDTEKPDDARIRSGKYIKRISNRDGNALSDD
jgi:hypothetical protein